MVFIQLPKFKKAPSALSDNTDKWLFLLKNMYNLKSCPPEIQGDPFKLLLDIAELKHLTQEDMDRYAVSLEKSYQMSNIADFAREEGRKEGLKEGELKGIRKGLFEGKMDIAIRLLKRNEPIDEIILLTELSREEIMSIINQLPKA